jgi:AraC-like DNA-binding protein
MPYLEVTPVSALSPWVECAWSLDSVEPVFEHRVPPDGALDLVYDRRNGLRAVGTMTRQQSFDFPDGASMAGIRFRPGMARTFLGVPPELTDRTVPLEELWDRRARELLRKLDDAKSIQEAMSLLLSGLGQPGHSPNPVQHAIGAIADAHGNADLDRIASHANLSPRQFRRRCLEESGLTPKHLCRVLRFRHACRMAEKQDRPNWSGIAAEVEYFDQAHLIRDFHEFTGTTPMAVFSNTRVPESR